MRVFLDFEYHPQWPIITWQPRLFAQRNSGPISDVRLMDLTVAHEADCLLRGISGGHLPRGKDYETRFPPEGLRPWEKSLAPGDDFQLDCGGCGKSSAQQIPIWLYHHESAGCWFGPEYAGTWELEAHRDKAETRLQLRLPYLDFRMMQGEEIALPAFSMGTWEGDRSTGQNHLRSVIREHFMAHDENDKPILPPVMHQGLFGQENYYSEDGIKKEMARAAEIGCEYYVFNAHWFFGPVQEGKYASSEKMPWGDRYVQCWFNTMGEYELSPDKFPSGSDKLRDYVESLGMKLGYWFDPRFGKESQSLQNHPAIAYPPDPESAAKTDFLSPWLVDLGRQAGRDWIEAHLERMITEYHGKWIWLDNNFYPRHQYWNHHEEKDRKGLMELHYYQGFYEVFDRVMKRHPDVRVEMCANGGMLIDLGTIRRSHAIWVNDWVGFEGGHQEYDTDVNRNHRAGASHWLPGALIVNSMYIPWKVTQDEALYPDIHFVSHFAGTIAFGQRMLMWKQSDLDNVRRLMDIYKEFRPWLLKDYYQLLPMPDRRDAWDAWQFHDPENCNGWVILFRFPESTDDTIRLSLQAIGPSGELEWETMLDGGKVQMDQGRLTVTLEKGTPMILRYQEK
ncbi:MAG: alpha-galactosidase [Candidatus Sumerlaeia bacterium]